ncbi:MAG: hypothetical protein ACMG6E_09020 [Candidatus Roizmanbacteria bacterium]
MNLQIKFADKLKYLSLDLKNKNIQERPQILKQKLGTINEWINEHVRG